MLPGLRERKAIGDTVLFGSYPQSKVTDSTTKSTLTSKAGTLPSSSNSQKWTPYNWYISSSNTTKFAWYIDLDTNSDGQNDYRGVYFTSCRPFRVSGTSYEGGSKQYLMVIQNPLSIGLNMNQLNGEY